MSSYCTETSFQVAPGVSSHDYTRQEVEAAGGCCQLFVCGIPCPPPFDRTGVAWGFGLPVCAVSLGWVVMGVVIAYLTLKADDYRGYFVCNRTLPLYIVAFALLGQGLDTSSSLGNIVASYKYSFWDGAVMPIGVALSLILNGFFLAAPLNRMGLLTLPDLFRRKYGTLMEVMVSCIEIASFTVLLAGNLVGISLVLQFCFGLPKGAGIAISGGLLGAYTASGGLYSVALTDAPQVVVGLSGLLVSAVYLLATDPGPVGPGPSVGFSRDLGGNVTAHTPRFAGPADCTGAPAGTCDNYAYPAGDKPVHVGGMTDPDAYAPLPNPLLYNWASIFVLGFGNLCALDFQARCIAARTPSAARVGCFIAGGALLVLALPFGLLGGLARKYYGPDSPHAVFHADSCSAPLGRASCAEWVPDGNSAVFMFLWERAPHFIGAWAMVAMVTASISTADGAILATSTVAAHNLWRKVPRIGSHESNLLLVARLFIIPMTLLACMTAVLAYRPAYLLVVSFDIVLAGVFVPLVAAVYAPDVTPNAGILACLVGCLLRITLEQVLPKDGSLVVPIGQYGLAYGRALAGLPSFMQVTPPDMADAAHVWNPDKDTCDQKPLEDWTGLDSLLSPAFSALTMAVVTLAERRWGTDVLWFVPKAWRQASPLYLGEDPSVRPAAKQGPSGLAPTASKSRGWLWMPSVPEDVEVDAGSGGGSGGCSAAGEAGSAVDGGAGSMSGPGGCGSPGGGRREYAAGGVGGGSSWRSARGGAGLTSAAALAVEGSSWSAGTTANLTANYSPAVTVGSVSRFARESDMPLVTMLLRAESGSMTGMPSGSVALAGESPSSASAGAAAAAVAAGAGGTARAAAPAMASPPPLSLLKQWQHRSVV
ncbi:hypothetical protein HYH03_007778 [Edaphochlamys debaryana]|uniref:Uncharacterized protein n=1 Tax=Edaphochlamys debaryana TaxID=47281 RepID=A0A836BZN6_9CHLO|nr:hypothetical protein HYH03_007778 [Edaphochlamys debaryana]|eukprot:KAG2494142.1 hypothetical protein HYH03_007778 [Edaphochlamys debaryana]